MHGDEQQVAVLADQLETALACREACSAAAADLARLRPPRHAAHEAGQQYADHEHDAGADQSRRSGPYVPTSWPARTDPTHAPRLLPTPMSGKSRLPCSGVKRSLANAQNCAITITLKMPIQRK